MAYWQNAKTVPATPCLSELYRLYTSNMMDSYIDLCLYPFPNAVYSAGETATLSSGMMGKLVVPINQYWCSNCPVGPFLDYSGLVRSLRLVQMQQR